MTWNFTLPPNIYSFNNCSIKFTVIYFQTFLGRKSSCESCNGRVAKYSEERVRNFYCRTKGIHIADCVFRNISEYTIINDDYKHIIIETKNPVLLRFW